MLEIIMWRWKYYNNNIAIVQTSEHRDKWVEWAIDDMNRFITNDMTEQKLGRHLLQFAEREIIPY